MTEIGVMTRSMHKMAVESRNDAPAPPSGGLCSGMDTKWWYPGFGAKKAEQLLAKQAIATCKKCPIRKSCLDYSIRWEAFGIWAGFTERQRDMIRRELDQPRNVGPRAYSRPPKLNAEYNLEKDDCVWLRNNGYF